MSPRPATHYLEAYTATGSATRAAQLLGCSKRVVYVHLQRAGIKVRPYRRLRLVPTPSDPFAAWQAVRKRAIDMQLAQLRRERTEWTAWLDNATNGKGYA